MSNNNVFTYQNIVQGTTAFSDLVYIWVSCLLYSRNKAVIIRISDKLFTKHSRAVIYVSVTHNYLVKFRSLTFVVLRKRHATKINCFLFHKYIFNTVCSPVMRTHKHTVLSHLSTVCSLSLFKRVEVLMKTQLCAVIPSSFVGGNHMQDYSTITHSVILLQRVFTFTQKSLPAYSQVH